MYTLVGMNKQSINLDLGLQPMKRNKMIRGEETRTDGEEGKKGDCSIHS